MARSRCCGGPLPAFLALIAAGLLVISALAQQDLEVPGVRRDLRPAAALRTVAVMAEARGSAAADVDTAADGDVALMRLAEGLAAASPAARAADALLDCGLGPVVCNTLDCPTYKVLERYDSTELRRYDPATFSSTVLSLDDEGSIEKAAIIGFHRLLKYNLGDNEDSKKVSMTAPVLYALDVDRKGSTRRDIRFRDRFSVSFFVPFKYQEEPPSPSSPEVFLVDVKEVDIFVRSFDGYATGARIHRVASAFLRDLYDDGHRVDCRTVYVAQYSPPFQPVFRYNEVWFLRRRRGRGTVGTAAADPEAAIPDAEGDFDAADDSDAADSCRWLLSEDATPDPQTEDDGGQQQLVAQ